MATRESRAGGKMVLFLSGYEWRTVQDELLRREEAHQNEMIKSAEHLGVKAPEVEAARQKMNKIQKINEGIRYISPPKKRIE